MDFDSIKVGDEYACYTFVQYFGSGEKGCRLWQVKCSHCRRVSIAYLGHKYINDLWKNLVNYKSGDECICAAIKDCDTRSTLRKVYQGVRSKCCCDSTYGYYYYGQKGVTVCERWLDKMNGFINFLIDMGPRQNAKHVLKLKKGSKEFNKENCYWALRRGEIREPKACQDIKVGQYYEVKPDDVSPVVPPFRMAALNFDVLHPDDFS